VIYINILIIKGNLTKDVELKFSQAGMAIAKFTVAVARMKKDDGADFFNCTAFSKTAELIADSLRKGSPILINGHVTLGSYEDKEGVKKYTTDVMVDRFEFIGKKEENQGSTDNRTFAKDSDITPIDDGDIPF